MKSSIESMKALYLIVEGRDRGKERAVVQINMKQENIEIIGTEEEWITNLELENEQHIDEADPDQEEEIEKIMIIMRNQ